MTLCKSLPFLIVSFGLMVVLVLSKERVYYVEMERLNVTYWNPAYYAFVNCSARRYSRRDLVHYVSMHIETLVPLGKNLTVDVFVYEFLSNEYRRSFVEMHINICDMVFKDQVFGPFIRAHIPYKSCPLPKAVYDIKNLSFWDLPLLSTFPFQKGRVYVNLSLTNPGTKPERMIEGFVDSMIKSRWR